MKKLIFFLFVTGIILLWLAYLAGATPDREAGTTDAKPIVAYGKDSTGTIHALITSATGELQGG